MPLGKPASLQVIELLENVKSMHIVKRNRLLKKCDENNSYC